MSSNHDSFDQAEALRKQMEETQIMIEESQSSLIESSPLPPRSEVHRKKEKKKTKIRIRYPLVRLLALTFVLIVFLVASYNLWKDNVQLTNASKDEETTANNSNIDIFEIKSKSADSNNEPEVEDNFEVAQTQHEADKPAGEELKKVSPDGQANEAAVPKEETANPVNTDNTQNNPPAPSAPAANVQQSSNASTNTAPVQTQKPEQKYLYHKVKAGETLYRISMRYFKSRAGEEIIKRANELDANGTVMAGQLLKIPIN